MLINKNKDMTPYDLARRPAKQYPFLMPLVWGGAFALTRQFGLKFEKVNMANLKPPFLVIGTHQGFSDYYIGPLSVYPRRAMYVSDMEGFAGFGNWLYRGIGCIGKRRFVADYSVISNIRYAIKQKQIVFLYPESRHSNIGTTGYIPKDMGRLCKLLKVPVVILSCNGSYLANPFWNEEKTRKVPMKARMECIYSASELEGASADEIQSKIESMLQYDEYDYQHKAGFKICDKDRAEGLHKALYVCRKCGSPYKMSSSGSILKCASCGSEFELTEDGWMTLKNPSSDDVLPSKIHLPDWYEWQRSEVINALEASDIQNLRREYKVRVEALPNHKGFVDLGDGKLLLNGDKYELKFTSVSGENLTLEFPHRFRESVQTEYNYRGKGCAIVLSTKDCCYYLYSDDLSFNPTEQQFIGEYLFQKRNGLL